MRTLIPNIIHRWGRWLLREIFEPWFVVTLVYIGVMSSILLPQAILIGIFGAGVGTIGVVITPAAALPLSIVVYDRHAYLRWTASQRAPLATRMLRAVSDGVQWVLFLRR